MKTAILIPCHNSAAYLPDLFIGIGAQLLQFDEVICYDDASDDETCAVARALGAKVLVGRPNHGAGYARNRLIEASTADWIHFHDSDDLVSPEFLAKMTAAATAGVGGVLCNIDVRYRRSRLPYGFVDYSELVKTPDQIAYFLANIGFASQGLYARGWLDRIGGFRQDIRGNEDPDLHIRLAAAGCQFRVLPEALVTKLEHEDSYSARNRLQCAVDKLKCLENYFVILPPKYRSTIGREALATASYIYQSDVDDGAAWMERGIALADACGVVGAACMSNLKDRISQMVGVRNVFRFRRWRRQLRGVMARQGHV